MTSCPEVWAEDFEIWGKSVSWVPGSERESRDSELREARRICALRAPRVGWVESWRCKSSLHRKIVSLSSCRKTFNSKVIKFRTWTIRILWVCYIRRFFSCSLILGWILITKRGRCPWCNDYHRRTRWHELKSWTRLITFHIAQIPLGKVWIQLFSLQLWINRRADWIFSLGEATSLGEGKLWIQTC